VILPNAEKMGDNTEEAFRQELMDMSGIVHASISTSVPPKIPFGDDYVPEATGVSEPLVKELAISSFMVDEEFIPALNIHLTAGRNFSKAFNDSASVILNETAVRQIGWKDPIGKILVYPGHNDFRFKVIGVAKDFNTESLKSEVSPFALFHHSSKTYSTPGSFVLVSVKSQDIRTVISDLEKKWKAFAPAVPFEYSFLDKNFEELYRAEERMGTVFGIFTFLSIAVACLGLFGLSVYTAERRKKEIGVRKVLGASVRSVVSLISKEFVKLVCISALIASPLAWWAMDTWLRDFAYRISIQWWVFAFAALMALLIAIITISFQAIKAAVANPVRSLRTE
jgi:putative ABC transport system permease protein